MNFFTEIFPGFDLLFRNPYFRAGSDNTYYSAGNWLDILTIAKISARIKS